MTSLISFPSVDLRSSIHEGTFQIGDGQEGSNDSCFPVFGPGSAAECKGDPRAGYSMGGVERLGCTQPIHGLCCGWLFPGLRLSLTREHYQKEQSREPLLYHLSLVCVHGVLPSPHQESVFLSRKLMQVYSRTLQK